MSDTNKRNRQYINTEGLVKGIGFVQDYFREIKKAQNKQRPSFSDIPLSHLTNMELEAPSTVKLYKNLDKLEADVLKLLHIKLINQKESTHNANKLMLGNLGFLPTAFLGISGALTLKGLLDLDTSYLIIIVISTLVLSFAGVYIRDSVGRYQEVIEILQSVINTKQNPDGD